MPEIADLIDLKGLDDLRGLTEVSRETKAATALTPAPQPTHAGLIVRAGDTGRVLLLQRSMDPEDPARGQWEFPGGGIEDGESPLEAAHREFAEETGLPVPDGTEGATYTSPNGVYAGHIHHVPTESAVPINPSGDDRTVLNPDDPDGDNIEVAAWFDPAHLPLMPALRSAVQTSTPWDLLASGPYDPEPDDDGDEPDEKMFNPALHPRDHGRFSHGSGGALDRAAEVARMDAEDRAKQGLDERWKPTADRMHHVVTVRNLKPGDIIHTHTNGDEIELPRRKANGTIPAYARTPREVARVEAAEKGKHTVHFTDSTSTTYPSGALAHAHRDALIQRQGASTQKGHLPMTGFDARTEGALLALAAEHKVEPLGLAAAFVRGLDDVPEGATEPPEQWAMGRVKALIARHDGDTAHTADDDLLPLLGVKTQPAGIADVPSTDLDGVLDRMAENVDLLNDTDDETEKQRLRDAIDAEHGEALRAAAETAGDQDATEDEDTETQAKALGVDDVKDLRSLI